MYSQLINRLMHKCRKPREESKRVKLRMKTIFVGAQHLNKFENIFVTRWWWGVGDGQTSTSVI